MATGNLTKGTPPRMTLLNDCAISRNLSSLRVEKEAISTKSASSRVITST